MDIHKSNDKPVAIILGGTNPHITLIKKLKQRGYYTILVDYLNNPPAAKTADEHIIESTMDKDKVCEIVRNRKAALVITTNIDQANATACYAAEKNGIKPPYSYETAINVTDKSKMKAIMRDNGISTSSYVEAHNIEDIIGHVSYPSVIKPADSKGSRGVYKIMNEDELKHYYPMSRINSNNGIVIAEDYVEGTEVSFYYYVQDGTAHFIYAYRRYNFASIEEDVIQSTGVVFPADVSDKAYQAMQETADAIVKAFGLDNTPLFVQAIIKDDKPWVLEFAPRIGGGLSYRVIERDCKFDLIDAAICSFEGEKVDIHVQKPDYCSGILNIYAPGIVMGEIKGVNSVIDNGMASEFYQYHMQGSDVRGDMSSGSRVGAFLIHKNNVEEIRKCVKFINDHVEVYDIDGNKAMRHDIYDVWNQ